MSKVLAIAQFGFGALDMLEETLSQFMLSTSYLPTAPTPRLLHAMRRHIANHPPSSHQ